MRNQRNEARQSRATEKFRDDIDPANTWVIGDTHFGHENIIGFCYRPLDHEHVMMDEWARAVPDDATVIHVGDLCYRSNARFKNLIAPHLTGARKLLIEGNHDRQRYSFYRDCGFKLAKPFSITHLDPNKGRLCDVSFAHYPWSEDEEGRAMQPWEWRVHGHIHNNGYTREGFVPFLRNHINVSVEQLRYTPVNLKVLLEAAIEGHYEETTRDSKDEARQRAIVNRTRKKPA